jgi:hypothetical protein
MKEHAEGYLLQTANEGIVMKMEIYERINGELIKLCVVDEDIRDVEECTK